MASLGTLVALIVAAGALLAFRSPINASLARTVGVLEAAPVSLDGETGLLPAVLLVRTRE